MEYIKGKPLVSGAIISSQKITGVSLSTLSWPVFFSFKFGIYHRGRHIKDITIYDATYGSLKKAYVFLTI
jgi:hypothetical protein